MALELVDILFIAVAPFVMAYISIDAAVDRAE